MLPPSFTPARLYQRLRHDPRARTVAARLPPAAQRLLRRVTRPDPPRWGNLRRTRPFSERYGFDRGTPIDRYYLERFLGRHAGDVRGRVLEVRDSRYTDRFGGERVEASDVLDIDPRNVDATLVADLAEPGSLPAGAFDCFILVQTLQYVADPATALRNALECIRDGGVLLLSVPAISRIDPALAAVDRWRLTKAGLAALLAATAEAGSFSVTACGNVLTASAFLMGLAADELTQGELDHVDPAFEMLVCARVQKHAP